MCTYTCTCMYNAKVGQQQSTCMNVHNEAINYVVASNAPKIVIKQVLQLPISFHCTCYQRVWHYVCTTYICTTYNYYTYVHAYVYMCIAIRWIFVHVIDAVVSLEQSEYLVANEDGTVSVMITTSAVVSEDVIVEVTIKDGTATGKYTHVHLQRAVS